MKRAAFWLASLLFLLTVSLLAYRILWLGYPVFPTAPGRTWNFSAEVHFAGEPKEKNISFILALPHEQPGQMVIEERINSGNLNFTIFRYGRNRAGVWSGSIGPEGEIISYRATVFVRQGAPAPAQTPGAGNGPAVEKEEQDLAERLAKSWVELPPMNRVRAAVSALAGDWGDRKPPEGDILAWKAVQGKYGPAVSLQVLLQASRLPARSVQGFRLMEGIQTRPFTWVEVWTGKKWEPFRPETGEAETKPHLLLRLADHDFPASSMMGMESPEVRWTLSREVISQWRLHFERMRRSDRILDQFSLFHLPPEYQQTFRILLLVPIGTLIIGFLRNIVGFPTFGIFMPVLMALAFRNTGLAYGLGIFGGVLLIGYATRRQVDKLRLLLVPRMSLMVTLVIVCFTAIALLGNKIGVRQLMAVGLLPFVILTMVIERFFLVVEEAGAREAFKTALGSAAAAFIGYGIISWEPLQLTFFVYPELLFAVGALQVLLGRYTGYRVSEIFRFRDVGGRR